MLRTVLSLTLLLFSASFAAGQEPNPAKSSQPWPLDQRCAIMAAHPANQGALTSACIASQATVPILPQPAVPARSIEPVAAPSAQQPSRSHSGGAGRED